MTAFLIDTCVIIDYLRDRHEVVDFIPNASARPSVSAVTAAEALHPSRRRGSRLLPLHQGVKVFEDTRDICSRHVEGSTWPQAAFQGM